jgi:hypothetical protein
LDPSERVNVSHWRILVSRTVYKSETNESLWMGEKETVQLLCSSQPTSNNSRPTEKTLVAIHHRRRFGGTYQLPSHLLTLWFSVA